MWVDWAIMGVIFGGFILLDFGVVACEYLAER